MEPRTVIILSAIAVLFTVVITLIVLNAATISRLAIPTPIP